MKDMYREKYWKNRGHYIELYPNVYSNDAPVPFELPVPNYYYGSLANMYQSRHTD